MAKKKKRKNGETAAKKKKQLHTPKPLKPEHIIQLSPKIPLEKSDHSYVVALGRKYGNWLGRFGKILLVIIAVIGGITLIMAIGLITLFVIFGRDLPDVRELKNISLSETTRIYDRERNLLYSIFDEENRKYVPLAQISPAAIQATLSIEDKNFYNHLGIDAAGMVRAQLRNIKDESISQGASTITQQLAKNFFLSSERTYQRKVKEVLLALEIEWFYSKEEILEMYLNKISYGNNSFGIETAAQTYFGKSAKDLTLVESAVLASLPKAPSYYSPYGQNKDLLMGYCKLDRIQAENVELVDGEENAIEGESENAVTKEIPAKTVPETIEQPIQTEQKNQSKCTSPGDPNYIWGRKDFVLQRMQLDNKITVDDVNNAWKEGFDLKFNKPGTGLEAPHFVFYVKDYLEKKYGKDMVENGGLEVITSLDPRLQSTAEEAVKKQAPINLKYYRANNAGLVSIDPRNGQVLAMVGSVDYHDLKIDGQVNVTTSMRQPGSSFKPLIYAAAVQNAGIGSGTILGDYKTLFNAHDIPRNSDNGYKGKMTIRQALSQSRNIPAIKAYYLAGEEEKIMDFLDKIGLNCLRQFKTEFNKTAGERGWTFSFGWPMAIGSGEVKLVDLAGAYGSLANEGKYAAINPILEIRDRKGNILEKADKPAVVQVMDPQTAYIISSIISDVMARPAGSWRNSLTIPGHTVAAKTGTSNKKIGRRIAPNNNVVIGYTPSMVVAVWVGNSDGSHMSGDAWAFADAGPIWKEFFIAALKDKPDEKFIEPPGIKHIGREIYPSFAVFKDWDSKFKRLSTQQSQTTEQSSSSATILPPALLPKNTQALEEPDWMKGSAFPPMLPEEVPTTIEPRF